MADSPLGDPRVSEPARPEPASASDAAMPVDSAIDSSTTDPAESGSLPAASASGPKRQVDVFADGSLRHDLGVGGWAFAIALAGGGCEPGHRVEPFELRGVTEGLRALAGFDATDVRIFSDCSYVLACVQMVQENKTSPGPKIPVLDSAALREAIHQLGPQARISVARPEKTSTAHRWCHKEARRRVEEFIRNSEVYRERIRRAQLNTLCRERDALLKRLRKFDARIAAAQAELQGSSQDAAPGWDDEPNRDR
jgi:ribonuclease HI